MTHTRKMAIIAILSAISFLLMFFDFPILPGASFLKLDFTNSIGISGAESERSFKHFTGSFSAQTSTEQPRGQYLHWFADEYHCSCCFRNRFCAYLEKRTDNRSFSDCFCGGNTGIDCGNASFELYLCNSAICNVC